MNKHINFNIYLRQQLQGMFYHYKKKVMLTENSVQKLILVD